MVGLAVYGHAIRGDRKRSSSWLAALVGAGNADLKFQISTTGLWLADL